MVGRKPCPRFPRGHRESRITVNSSTSQDRGPQGPERLTRVPLVGQIYSLALFVVAMKKRCKRRRRSSVQSRLTAQGQNERKNPLCLSHMKQFDRRLVENPQRVILLTPHGINGSNKVPFLQVHGFEPILWFQPGAQHHCPLMVLPVQLGCLWGVSPISANT